MYNEKRKDCNENFAKSINNVNDDMFDKNANIIMSKRRKLVSGFTKGRLKKDYEKPPLPMKLRALPESFWQQPNHPTQAPGGICPELPLICKEENGTNSCQNTDTKSTSLPPPEITTPANTELLFSLFRVVDKRKSLIRRGRPRKPVVAQVGLRDADPCLVSNEPPLVAGNKGRDNVGGSYSNLLAELVVRL